MSDINIVFTRVDNRLVHGQVGNVWVTASGANLILVVDDESRMRKLIKDFLIKDNYNVLEAEDGQKALEIFEKELLWYFKEYQQRLDEE